MRIAAVKRGDIQVATARDFVQPQQFVVRRQRDSHCGDQFARPQIEFLVAFVEIVDVHLAVPPALRSSSTASMTNRNGSESAIGEALAMLPPIVPTCRICGAPNTDTIL